MPTPRTPHRRPRAARPATVSRLAASAAAPLLAALFLGGCAAPAERGADAVAPAPAAVGYTVRPGDRLGDIARELTGDLSHWKAIAAYNGIEDPRALRAGTVLRVPVELLPARDVAPAAVPALAVRGAPSAPVELSSVDVNRRFELAPLDGPVPAAAAAPRAPARSNDAAPRTVAAEAADAPSARRVKVLGSYFPKGVYARPATYSRLMMRVAPGTLFELDDELRGWYGVVTPEGVGYLHHRDGRIVEDGAADARTASLEG